MAPMFSIIDNGEEAFVTVIIPGRNPLVAGDSHPNYQEIIDFLTGASPFTDDELADLFDVAATVAKRFIPLTERVSVGSGRVYFDGDEVNDSLTTQIVRFLDEGVSDWLPLVRFMENVAGNPQEHSREQLYDWLKAHDFTITPDGRIVGYKGVTKADDGSLVSRYTGTAIVDGETVHGHIPNAVGSVVTMPRSEVAFDPATSCSTGLHVGTFSYASDYASGAMLKVYVNPRDVVSVPTDASGEKVRVCRYEVAEIIDAPVKTAVEYDCDEYDEDEYVDNAVYGTEGESY